MKLQNKFKPDPDLLPTQRSTLDDYTKKDFQGIDYDRGHMTPDADMPTKNASYQSFSILNMTPQIPDNNRNAWEDMEELVRDIAMKGEVYVISGPIFENLDTKLKDGTFVPTAYYKIIYIKDAPQPKCMYIKNQPKQVYETKEISECETLTGLKFQ
jgi:endonuclease G